MSENLDKIPFTDLAAMARDVWPELQAPFTEALLNAAYIGGPAVATFEREWAAACTTEHAIGVANGTDALLLSLEAIGLAAGDEVILPSNTFIATAEAVVRAGGTPRFADVDPGTMLLTPETVAAQVTDRTKGVIAVHLYGQMPDMDALAAQAAELGLFLLEDAAQAHGARWAGRLAGSFGYAGCFSFYPGKNLGAFGDGGAVVTNDARIAETVRTLANHGRASGSAHYEHELVGTNSRLDSLQALALSAKLKRNDGWNADRRRIADIYRERFAGTAVAVQEVAEKAEHVYHLFVVQVDDRDAVRDELGKRGVATGIHYPLPCHQQPPLAKYAVGPLPVVEAIAPRLVSLPMFPHMTDAQAHRVADELLDVVAGLAAKGAETGA